MKGKVYTSLYLSVVLRNKFELCVEKLGVDPCQLLSVLCYKAGMSLSKEVRCFEPVEYQDRGVDYEITPVYFFDSDHEYMHANRLAGKVSVSKLLACAMELFLDEIMEKGINHMDLARLQVKKNNYKTKTYFVRNCIVIITKNDKFEEYIMKMRMKKNTS